MFVSFCLFCFLNRCGNAWGNNSRLTRIHGLVTQLIEHGFPDVVCVQEMTASTLRVLMAMESIRGHYCISTNVEEFELLSGQFGYDVVILAKHWIARRGSQLWRAKLTSRYGRGFLYFAPLLRGGKQVAIGTVHLESTVTYVAARQMQLKEIYSVLGAFEGGSIMCGDWNSCETEGEHHFDDSVSVDVWRALHGDGGGGWTEDPTVNVMLRSLSKPERLKTPQVRYDRILVNGKANELLAPLECRLIGTAPIPRANWVMGDAHDQNLGNQVWISDHFGVMAVFAFK